MKKELFTKLYLHLFAEGGEGGAGGEGQGDAGEQAPAAQEIQYGKPAPEEAPEEAAEPAAEEPADLSAEFDALIRDKFKGEYDKRVQAAIKSRFKPNSEQAKKAKMADAIMPALDKLAMKYNLPADATVEQIVEAVQSDNRMLEDAAAEHGLTLEQYQRMMNAEREAARYRAADRARKQQQQAEAQIQRWTAQAEETKAMYPDFDLKTEIDPETSPDTAQRFLQLLQSGVDVKTVYQLIHMNDLIGGAMQKTAQVVQKKMSDDIRARGQRPQENGAAKNAPSTVRKMNPAELSNEDLDIIHKRVMAGEGPKIYF